MILAANKIQETAMKPGILACRVIAGFECDCTRMSRRLGVESEHTFEVVRNQTKVPVPTLHLQTRAKKMLILEA
jgi:hypothetical protein